MKSHTHFRHMKHMNWNSEEFEKRRKRGRIAAGLVFIITGGLWLASSMGVFIPWTYTWPFIFAMMGFYLLVKNGLKRPGGYVMLFVSAVWFLEQSNLIADFRNVLWPALVILFGIALLFKPKRNKYKTEEWKKWDRNAHVGDDNSTADNIQVNAIMGGVEKVVISKNFQGGQLNCVLGGAEINLMQADFEGSISMEVNAILGGVEITLPAHWNVKNDISVIMGGVSDNRNVKTDENPTGKVLILTGNAILGGIEIKGY